jgi:hypothetical protein
MLDRRSDLANAQHTLARAVDERDRTTRAVAVSEAERDRLGPLTKLRRGGRDDSTRADQNLAAHRHLHRAGQDLDTATARVAQLEAAVAARAAWDRTEGWRVDRIAEIDGALAHHWAQVTLRAVQIDDPLAYGIHQLRHARDTYQAELDHIQASLPPDRRDALTHAQNDLAHRTQRLRAAGIAVARARVALDEASDTGADGTSPPSTPPNDTW